MESKLGNSILSRVLSSARHVHASLNTTLAALDFELMLIAIIKSILERSRTRGNSSWLHPRQAVKKTTLKKNLHEHFWSFWRNIQAGAYRARAAYGRLIFKRFTKLCRSHILKVFKTKTILLTSTIRMKLAGDQLLLHWLAPWTV